MNSVLGRHSNQGRASIRRVYFTGDTAVSQGQPVMKNRTWTGTDTEHGATYAWEGRANGAKALAATGDEFLGVATQAYSAKTGGQWIEIYEVGSVCLALTKYNITTLGTLLKLDISDGCFSAAGAVGNGACAAMQTIDTSGGAALALVELLDGAIIAPIA